MSRLGLNWTAWLAWSAASLIATVLLIVANPDNGLAAFTGYGAAWAGTTGLAERRRSRRVPPREPVTWRTAAILCAIGFLVNVVVTVVVANNGASFEGPGALWFTWVIFSARYYIRREFL